MLQLIHPKTHMSCYEWQHTTTLSCVIYPDVVLSVENIGWGHTSYAKWTLQSNLEITNVFKLTLYKWHCWCLAALHRNNHRDIAELLMKHMDPLPTADGWTLLHFAYRWVPKPVCLSMANIHFDKRELAPIPIYTCLPMHSNCVWSVEKFTQT